MGQAAPGPGRDTAPRAPCLLQGSLCLWAQPRSPGAGSAGRCLPRKTDQTPQPPAFLKDIAVRVSGPPGATGSLSCCYLKVQMSRDGWTGREQSS